MIGRLRLASLVLLVTLAGVAAGSGSDPEQVVVTTDLRDSIDPSRLVPNGHRPLPGLLTGGQPSIEQLAVLADAGYETIVCLRTAQEGAPSLVEPARAMGLRYVHLPVADAGDLTPQNVAALGRVLTERAEHPVVLFCGSGNRAGAMLALEQAQVEGWAPDTALVVGLAGGLTGLEAAVRERLGLPPAEPNG